MPEEQIHAPEAASAEAEKTPEKDFAELAELRQRVSQLEGRLKKEPTLEGAQGAQEREDQIKQEIRGYLEDLQQSPSFSPPSTARDEADEIKKFEPNQQIGALISLALDKGLVEAISVARALDNPAILDELHDALVDHYYKVLIEKEILKLS